MTGIEVRNAFEKVMSDVGEQLPDISIQVMATWQEDGKTMHMRNGCGNFYARQGMCHDFVNADVACTNARQIVEQLRPNNEQT